MRIKFSVCLIALAITVVSPSSVGVYLSEGAINHLLQRVAANINTILKKKEGAAADEPTPINTILSVYNFWINPQLFKIKILEDQLNLELEDTCGHFFVQYSEEFRLLDITVSTKLLFKNLQSEIKTKLFLSKKGSSRRRMVMMPAEDPILKVKNLQIQVPQSGKTSGVINWMVNTSLDLTKIKELAKSQGENWLRNYLRETAPSVIGAMDLAWEVDLSSFLQTPNFKLNFDFSESGERFLYKDGYFFFQTDLMVRHTSPLQKEENYREDFPLRSPLIAPASREGVHIMLQLHQKQIEALLKPFFHPDLTNKVNLKCEVTPRKTKKCTASVFLAGSSRPCKEVDLTPHAGQLMMLGQFNIDLVFLKAPSITFPRGQIKVGMKVGIKGNFFYQPLGQGAADRLLGQPIDEGLELEMALGVSTTTDFKREKAADSRVYPLDAFRLVEYEEESVLEEDPPKSNNVKLYLRPSNVVLKTLLKGDRPTELTGSYLAALVTRTANHVLSVMDAIEVPFPTHLLEPHIFLKELDLMLDKDEWLTLKLLVDYDFKDIIRGLLYKKPSDVSLQAVGQKGGVSGSQARRRPRARTQI